MKKTYIKILSVVLCAVMVLGAAPLGGLVGLELPGLFDSKAEAATYSGTCGDNLTWSLDTETGVLNITGTGAMKNYLYTGTGYGAAMAPNTPWYRNHNYIKTVNIANGITTIGNNAFNGCDSLTSVIIPNSIITIGEKAFASCTDLTSVTIPDSVTTIGDYAFYNCTSLTSVTIPDSVTTIGEFAFRYCRSLTNTTIPNSVKSIGACAFQGCDSLTRVTIPGSVTSIGNSAFCDCDSLANVIIGSGVTSIINNIFARCVSLTSVTIPDSVTSIGSTAFAGCSSLKDVYYNGDIISWLKMSFNSQDSNPLYNGANLYFDGELVTDIVIPDGTESIISYAFSGCTSLTSVTIPDSVKTIGQYAFAYCYYLRDYNIPAGATVGYRAFYQCGTISPATKINISNTSYSCIVGEKFYISGDIEYEGNIGDITLTWTSGDGVKLYTPASVINSSANSASFSIEAEGIKEGTYTVTVSGGGASASCTVTVVKLDNKLSVTVEPVGGEYYLIDGKFYDSKLNAVSSLQYKVTVKNTLTQLYIGTITDEIKEKLKIENVSVNAGLSDYTNLLIDIADITELKNIGTLEYNQSKSVTVDVTPTGTTIPKNVTLDVTATADNKPSVSESASISAKDKLYNPYATLNVTVTPQSIDYKDKKYSADKVDFTVTVTNKIPTSFAGKASLIKQWADYDIKVSEIEITPDDSKLLKWEGAKTEKVNKTLRAGESYTFTASYKVNNWHKMDKEIKSETVKFVFDASTSSNSLSTEKTVTFINGDYDKKIEYEKKSLRELIQEMMNEVLKCGVLKPAERTSVYNILLAHLMVNDMDAATEAIDMANTVYELACYVDDVHDIGYQEAGDAVIEAISAYADKKYKEDINTCLEDLRDNESFEKFMQWYVDEQRTADSKNKKVESRCPVDVYVYDKNGNEVMAIIDNNVVKAEDGIHAFVCEDDKIFYLPTDADYDIKIIATGNGTMDYIITEYNDDNKLRKTVYEDIPLTVNETYNGTVTKHTMPDEESYNLISSDGTEHVFDKVEYETPFADIQLAIKQPTVTTINYGETLVLQLEDVELPEGLKVEWSLTGNAVTISVSEDGKECRVTSTASGNVSVRATVVDENGEPVLNAEGGKSSPI